MSIFQSKNITPPILSLINSSALTVILSALSFPMLDKKWQVIYVALCTFVASYFLFFYTLKYFIFRKIKLIYKLILDTKASKKTEFFYEKIVPRKSIDEVRLEVEKWANVKNIEIQNLKDNEQFRKEFLMNLAHELRTPIFTTQGYIHTLLAGAIHDETVRIQFLENAGKGIDRLAALSKDIEQISNLEGGKILLESEHFVIQDMVKDLFLELQMMAKAKNITLQIKPGTEAPLQVFADKTKIKQVVVNLLTNAIKYGFENTTVQAAFYILDERRILVEVSDSGSGIREEDLPRVFERFFRAHKGRDRKVGGTGLGLSIVKHIIEAHGQTVTVRSKVSVGSTFGFTLPRRGPQ